MAFIADLHIHSKYSRATSPHCDLEHLALWARKKGITVVGTGDFTHPAWLRELQDKLVPAEAGLFRLRPDLERDVAALVPRACAGPTRFLLSVEISTIYKYLDKTRKVHHLIYAPDFPAAGRLIQKLRAIGNLDSDGRPILGLDSRHLLELTLASDPGAFLVPAHIWTPWFSALGSKSGFDAVDDCYGDLAPHIFAVETGLSSDPAMNWRVASLDRFRLVSNSDAHSPEKLGREASAFACELDYFALRRALETGVGYHGTVEFFPEEGKYHLDGHRACGVRLEPAESRARGGLCPGCGKPLTIGVMSRVEELADKAEGSPPPATAAPVQSLVPLPEILGELRGTAADSKAVAQVYEGLLARLGPELSILGEVPLDEIARASSSLLGEAVARLRRGQVLREAGYDGEYGVIRLFRKEELADQQRGRSLFGALGLPERRGVPPAGVPPAAAPTAAAPRPPTSVTTPLPVNAAPTDHGADPLAGLDTGQRSAAAVTAGALAILAGPGSGKTRTLTHRIAWLVRSGAARPGQCLAVTFTRRAAGELHDRLQRLLPGTADEPLVTTFHGLALRLLREQREAAGLQRGFRVAGEAEQLRAFMDASGLPAGAARTALQALAAARRAGAPMPAELQAGAAAYRAGLEQRNLVDFDELVPRTKELLAAHPELAAACRERFPHLSVDEFQDIDAAQYELVQRLHDPAGSLCVIGDPDQAIYGFRGATAECFPRFLRDHPGAAVVRLTRNYRSQGSIVAASAQVLGSEPLPAAALRAARIVLHEAPTAKAEAEFVVHTVEELLGGHSFFSVDSGRSTGTGHALSFGDLAVLYRTEAQGAELVEALRRSGMPFHQRSHDALTAHAGVQALLAALDAGEEPAPVAQRLDAALAPALASLTAATAPALAQVLAQEALELLRPVALEVGADLERFLAELPLRSQADTWDARADRIALLTMHAAKGLEFAAVFVVGCEDGLLPLRLGAQHAGDVAEERRLFYVAMTRAREQLFLTRARRRVVRGVLQERAASPFLLPIAEALLERRAGQALPKQPAGRQLEMF